MLHLAQFKHSKYYCVQLNCVHRGSLVEAHAHTHIELGNALGGRWDVHTHIPICVGRELVRKYYLNQLLVTSLT